MPEKQEALASQEFIEIKSIENDTLILKNGNIRKVILVSGINFALKSEEEQGMIIHIFQGFLNSLDFSVQFFVHSRKINIDDYLKRLGDREVQEDNELLKNQIHEYQEFIRALVAQNAIMKKHFFVVIPYDSIQLPKAGTDIANKFLGFFKKTTPAQISTEQESDLKEKLEQLDQRVDHVINGLHQLGIRAVPLNNEELLELFYNLYNPATTEKKVGEIPKK